jgi:maltose O-acetyltransferase
MKDRMLRGEPYRPDDPELQADAERCRTLVAQFNAVPANRTARRNELLTQLLGSVGDRAEIRPPFQCDYGAQISIGDRSFVNFGAVILDVAEVLIGNDVMMGPAVQLLTATHPLDPVERRSGWELAKPITIGDDVWIGGGVIVCPGVSIGAESVIGAGSVVTRDVPPGVVAAGNPCRVLRPVPRG